MPSQSSKFMREESREIEKVVDIAYNAGKILIEEAKIRTADPEAYEHECVEGKLDGSLITRADKRVNRYVTKHLAKAFPNDGILAEESKDDRSRLAKSRVWIVDPLDGTGSCFLKGRDDYSVIIGRADKVEVPHKSTSTKVHKKESIFEPVLGVVYQPEKGRMMYATRGKGAFLIEGNAPKPKRFYVSTIKKMSDIRVVVCRSRRSRELKDILDGIPISDQEKQVMGTSGSIKTCIVAMGDADVFVCAPVLNPKTPCEKQTIMHEWDLCGPHCILEEAEGRMTDLAGEDIRYNKFDPSRRNGILVSNNWIHDEMLEYILETLTKKKKVQ